MYKVNISNEGGYCFKVKSKDYQFLIDLTAKSITPPDTLLASLGSCIGVYIRKYAEGANLKLDNFNVRIEADFCKERPIYFKNINVTIDLGSIQLEERRKKNLLDFVKNCPVHNTLESKPHIDINIA